MRYDCKPAQHSEIKTMMEIIETVLHMRNFNYILIHNWIRPRLSTISFHPHPIPR
jgi:hypothetical protein